MDSIYFEDPLGLLIELASYRFEPPFGYTHSDVLLEAHKLREQRGDRNIVEIHLADAIEDMIRRVAAVALRRPLTERPVLGGGEMATMKMHVLKPSVNNLTVRIFVRAAGLDFEEIDAWGNTRTPEFLAMNPAHLTPMIEHAGLPKATLWESCAIMQYLCNKHGLEQFYPSDPGKRAMIDSANFYLIGTLYPLVARATYPALGFPQYPGEVGSSDADARGEGRRPAGRRGRARRAARRLPRVLPRRQAVHRRRPSLDRRHPPGGDARVPGVDRLRPARLGEGLTWPRWRRISATPTPSRPPTCAATSST